MAGVVAGPEPAPPVIADLPVAEVAPAVATAGDDGVFDYRIPPALVGQVAPGVRVVVPLGGRTVEGFCVRVKTGSGIAPERLRDIAGVIDARPAFPASSLELAVWTARRYLCRPGEVLQASLPGRGLSRARTVGRLAVPAAEAEEALAKLGGRAPVQAAVLRDLLGGPANTGALRKRHGPRAVAALRELVKKGLAVTAAETVKARVRGQAAKPPSGGEPSSGGEPLSGSEPAPTAPGSAALRLTSAQEAALARILVGLGGGRPGETAGAGGRIFVLHGVTGSGKTEVYLRAAAEALAQGRQALILVPEVSLVPQTLDRVRAHLGKARVAVAHSYLGGRERSEAWDSVLRGEADVVVGARSAVFAPLARLGLIVLDEEHEDSYKQEEKAPRYHAREVAAWRASREGAALILASATPSLETYHRALTREYDLLELPTRAGGQGLPPVQTVDMRAELAAGNRSTFSRALTKALGESLAQGRQAILFLNRRGHSTFILCRDCGWVARCPDCDVSLTYHSPETDLACHYCGRHEAAPSRCPGCGGHRVRYFGAGTQKIEEETRLAFPEARVVRLDADVVRRGEAARVLALFQAGQADVLVGTQMVAKGLDIPGVALVAAVAADSGLHLPDFRSAEKTFRLLTQAAGRTGRDERPGRVIIQTYSPEHPAVVAAAGQDYKAFALSELEARRPLGYPPWRHLVRVEFSDPEEGKAREASQAFARALDRQGFDSLPLVLGAPDRPRYGGPAAAPLARLRGRYRWHVLVFCPDLEAGLEGVKAAVRQATGHEARGGRRRAADGPVTAVDVDPTSVL